jgi:NhaP-type Na+/H+ or K+/H+ antiporter
MAKAFSHSQTPRQRSDRHRSVISLLSTTAVVLLLSIVVLWHSTTTSTASSTASSTSTSKRTLTGLADVDVDVARHSASSTSTSSRWLEEQDPSSTDDDDGTRTETCKKYLYNFLNGTTDARDECQGMYNAYKAADCQDDTHVDILGHKHHDKNGTLLDDDVLIDDFFENWECCGSISTYYQKNCQESELHSFRLLGIMLVLLVCTGIKAMLKFFAVHWLPDACAFILVGAMVGGILRLIDRSVVQNKLSFDNDLFLQILLPPIIFQAALSIDKRAFRRDLFPILAFASLGTAFSAIAIGLITHHVSQWGTGQALPLLDSLVFGSLISSIDPVATLGILSGVGVSQTDTLYTLIFGESLLNDGVAIVLFDTLKSHLGDDAVLDQSAFRLIIKTFVGSLCGSVGIGLGCGMCCTIYFWALRGRQTAVTEVAIFFCWALIPYYIADGLHCSGIISIMVMGFFLDYYVIGGFQSEEVAWMDYMAMRCENENGVVMQQPLDRWTQLQMALAKAFSGRGHILSRSRHHVGFVAQVIASLMDTAIFAYLGLFLFSDNVWNFKLNLTAILSCVSSRAVMVVILSLLINLAVYLDFENTLGRLFRSCRATNNEDDESVRSDTRNYLDKRTQLILLLAGVRGAVSFALVENIPVWDAVTKTGSKFKPELKAMTSTSIVFTLFVFGALTYFTVQRGASPSNQGSRVMSPLTHRLMSEPLDSDDDNMSSSDVNSSALEIESRLEYAPLQPQPASERYRAPGDFE